MTRIPVDHLSIELVMVPIRRQVANALLDDIVCWATTRHAGRAVAQAA